MGFPKYANAAIAQPSINSTGWDEIRHKSLALGPAFETRKASQIVLQQYDPGQFLLTHCSIIASVDTENPGTPTGTQMVDGVQINRRYADYFVSPGTTKYINNNHDCWERKLLLSSFRTFIGAENYVEHVQIPELSKGKIIDAAARDIGDSIYVDILVATDRKHKPLIAAITSGQLSTLSMGAQVAFTICTKCGNVAEDELQLCRCIKYSKGNFFLDSMGKRRKVAELCGHILAEPGSVKFIEGSWVANPAFTGAVLRSILDPAAMGMAEAIRRKMQVAFSEPVRVSDPNHLQKAARFQGRKIIPADHLAQLWEGPSIGALHATQPFSTVAQAEENHRLRLLQIESAEQQQQDPGSFGGSGQDETNKAPKEESDPFDKPVKDLYKALVEKTVEKVKQDLDKGEKSKVRDVIDENMNDTLIKSSIRFPKWKKRAADLVREIGPIAAKTVLAAWVLYDFGGWEAVASAHRFNGREILALSRLVDRTRRSSMAGETRVYRTVVAVGGTAPYGNVNEYLAACREIMGRDPTESESHQLVTKGKLFSLGSP